MKKRINTTWLRTLTAVLLTSLLALLAAGCGGGGDGDGGAVTPPATATTLNAVLNGTQEVPAVTTAATGTATVTVDAAKTTITVTLNTAGLTGVTASHIHSGAAGANGGVMFSLFAAPATFTSPLTKILTSADFTPVAGITTFADAVTAILAGNAYINVHTTANAGGEIRGQLTP
jgi:CHRD domain-containing protein